MQAATLTHLIDEILPRFPVSGVRALAPISSGLMHSTWRLDSAQGPLILQRLHPKLATAEILDDYLFVTEHLASVGLAAPRVVPSRAGPLYDDGEASWRLTTRLPGETLDRVKAPWQAEAGARMLARFHTAMAGVEYRFKSEHPLHDTAAHLAGLERAVSDVRYARRLALIGEQVDQIRETLPGLMLPPGLPQRVVHGDPKISNLLFEGEQATAMIDLDTCNRHSVLVDLGDAIRSWCRDGAEDERQRFHIDRFEAILRGYAAEGPALSAVELALLPAAGRLIALELACRFARDALEDDYFAFDAQRYPDRPSHNRARMAGMLFLADDMRAHQDAMAALVQRYLGA